MNTNTQHTISDRIYIIAKIIYLHVSSRKAPPEHFIFQVFIQSMGYGTMKTNVP